MNYIRHLNAFFTYIKKDDNLTSSHVSLYLALFQYWNFNRFQNPFPIYRDDIMQLSKIGSKNTYHKCLKELHLAHYIIYHTKISKYQPVKISMLRLDIKQVELPYKQLDMFSPNIGTTSVPILTFACPKNEPLPVPFLGHLIKHINFNKTGKEAPAQNLLKNPGEKEAGKQLARVPNLGHSSERSGNPTLSEVEKFFMARNYLSTEAKKFFNHYKAIGWKIQGVTPIEDWGALAEKWMENTKQWASNTKSAKPVIKEDERTIQYLYERFLEAQQVFKFILPDHFDQLHLQLNETDITEARNKRINQVSGTNQFSLNELWQAYLAGDPQNELLKKDEPNLFALAKRMAVLKHFKEQQQAGATSLSC